MEQRPAQFHLIAQRSVQRGTLLEQRLRPGVIRALPGKLPQPLQYYTLRPARRLVLWFMNEALACVQALLGRRQVALVQYQDSMRPVRFGGQPRRNGAARLLLPCQNPLEPGATLGKAAAQIPEAP